MIDIKAGSVISSNNWSEPVEVKFIEQQGNYIHIIGSETLSRKPVDSVLSEEEFNSITIKEIKTSFSEDCWKVFLAVENLRYRFASLYDPLLAMNTSKVDPLPHQIEAVYGYVLKLPRIRFLIADDPGAGKTIMSGLIIKELKIRNLCKRILIVSPGHLKDQWRRELLERFDERFIVIDRGRLDSLYGENAWLRENQIITSIDFAKREEIVPSIGAAHFDLIVVDEAHKMSAYRYGNKTDKTSRYKLGEVLSQITEHFLFLTATPHKGDQSNFRLFLDLLEPGFFATDEMLQESIENKDNPLFIRRIKEDLKGFDGEPLFLPRNVSTISFNLGVYSPREKDLYNSLSKYVKEQYNKALTKDKKRNVAFALVILQRRLASSTFALLESLKRRKKKLNDYLEGAEQRTNQVSSIDAEDLEDMSEEDRWKEEEIWETLSVSENRHELRQEIGIIDDLIISAKKIINDEIELKLASLKRSLQMLFKYSTQELKKEVFVEDYEKTLDTALTKYPDKQKRKLLIFTESKDTLFYLERKIQEWGYTTTVIHGGMKLEERVEAEKIFKNETQVLIATEAAGEGINLQFCNLMINYDIPWNPNRLEQRMGRIHRYGQQKEVFIFNMVAIDTREGKVLNKLFMKIEEIRRALGNDKVFDVLNEIIQNKDLSHLLLDAAVNARNADDITRELDFEVDEEYISQIKEKLDESLATHYIDYTRIKEMEQRAKEYKLIPEYTRSFFLEAFDKLEGKYTERKDGFIAIDSVPFELRNISNRDGFKNQHGTILRRYPKVTFDKDKAFKNPDSDFVCFGHPLFESVMIWIRENYFDSLQKGATFIDPEGNLDGFIVFYEGEIKDGLGHTAGKRLFSFYLRKDNLQVKNIPTTIIWEIAPAPKPEPTDVDLEQIKNRSFGSAIHQLEEYKKKLTTERIKQADIKEKYGVKSLEFLIQKLDGELIELNIRKDEGDKVDLVIHNKTERLNKYQKSLDELTNNLEKEKSLTMSMPRFLGIIRVIPDKNVDTSMKSDAEIERIGMEVVMDYERSQDRIPEDVSAEDLGFDIRSKDKEGNYRYIEVKARSCFEGVCLTQNEWFKAQRFQNDYYLYVVVNAATNPEMYINQNPANSMEAINKVEIVRYYIPIKEIVNKGVKVNE